MPADYKYARHGEPDETRNRFSRLLILILLLFLLCLGLYGTFFFQIRNTNEIILAGRYAEAQRILHRWKWLPLVSAQVYEKIGIAELLAKGASDASPFFQSAEVKFFFRPAGIWQEVLEFLWGNGRYQDGLLYVSHL